MTEFLFEQQGGTLRFPLQGVIEHRRVRNDQHLRSR
jgi:hypothetical protein